VAPLAYARSHTVDECLRVDALYFYHSNFSSLTHLLLFNAKFRPTCELFPSTNE
jgi:hypothetical protein